MFRADSQFRITNDKTTSPIILAKERYIFYEIGQCWTCPNRRRVHIIERNSKDRKRIVTSREKEQRILRGRKMGDSLDMGVRAGEGRGERRMMRNIVVTMKLDPDTVL